MKIAVIIPVWNDANALAGALASVPVPTDGAARGTTGEGIEVIVVDGGSTDDSAAVARSAGARVLDAPRAQRAAQMNLGAHATDAAVLLFLHADTRLPAGWSEGVTTVLRGDSTVVGGAFRRRFVPGNILLRITGSLAHLRGRGCGWFLGDQAMFVRREVFLRLGGFAPLRSCEDLDLSRRLARSGRTRLLREQVLTSDRRFRRAGVVRQTFADMATVVRYLRMPEKFLVVPTERTHS